MDNSSGGGMFGKLINPDTGKAKAPAQQERGTVQPVVTPPPHPRQHKETTPLVRPAPKQQHAAVEPIEELRITLPLPTDQVLFLDQLERKIFAMRPQKFRSKQRLTKNSIIRAWLSVLQDIPISVANVEDEKDLLRRFQDAVGKNK